MSEGAWVALFVEVALIAAFLSIVMPAICTWISFAIAKRHMKAAIRQAMRYDSSPKLPPITTPTPPMPRVRRPKA